MVIAKLAWRSWALILSAVVVPAAVAPAAEMATSQAALVLPMLSASDRTDGAATGDRNLRPAVATAVTVSADGGLIAAGGDDHLVRVWDARSGEEVAELRGHQDWVRGLQIAADGSRLASVANDGALRFWNPITGAATTDQRRLARGPLASVAFHPDGRRVLTVGFRTPLQVFDLTNSQPTNDFACACEDTRCVAVSPDGRWAAAAGRNGQLRVWDMQTVRVLPDVPADTRRIYGVTFSPDSQMLVTGGDSRRLRFWNPESGELLAEIPTSRTKVRSLLFLNSEQLVVGGVDNSVSIWSISSRVPTRRLVGHTGAVSALACDASGRLLASASYDTTIRVWRLGAEGAAETALVDPKGLR